MKVLHEGPFQGLQIVPHLRNIFEVLESPMANSTCESLVSPVHISIALTNIEENGKESKSELSYICVIHVIMNLLAYVCLNQNRVSS